MTAELYFDMAVYKSYVQRGFCTGAGNSDAQVCVEVAAAIAAGLGDTDEPRCVSKILLTFGLRLNDAVWSTHAARAAGMARFGIAQLGTKGSEYRFNESRFVQKMTEWMINVSLPKMLLELYDLYCDPRLAMLADELSMCHIDDYAGIVLAAGPCGVPDALWPSFANVLCGLLRNTGGLEPLLHRASLALAATAADQTRFPVHCGAAIAVPDSYLIAAADQATQVLIDMNTPGSKLLEQF